MIGTETHPRQAGSERSDSAPARFEALLQGPAASEPDWLVALRKAGFAHFSELGFPGTDHEEWRFTSISPIAKLPFLPLTQEPSRAVRAEEIRRFGITGMECVRLVFVDGHFSPGLSSIGCLPDGVIVASLADTIASRPELVEAHLGRQARSDENAFVALNTAFFRDGAFISAADGVRFQEPIHLLFIAASPKPGASASPRNLIVAGAGSVLEVIENYVTLVDAPYFTNAVTEMTVGEGAQVEHCKLQAESLDAFHIATIQARQEASSFLLSHSISTGAKIARNDIRAVFDGERAECLMNGLYLAVADQLVDHHTVMDHARPHCNSHEFYHGILDGRSRGVFNGKIFVRKDAQKTDAKQTSKNLLLSGDATIDTKPQLEIFADDVKCTHGATVGQISEEQLFYLRARGIGEEAGRRMLIHAFASDVINRIKLEPVRNELEKLMTIRLDHQPAKG